jgi:hypothetical protein
MFNAASGVSAVVFGQDTVSQLPFISSFCPSSKGPASLTAAGLGDVFGRYCTNAFSTYTELMEACALAVYLGLVSANETNGDKETSVSSSFIVP